MDATGPSVTIIGPAPLIPIGTQPSDLSTPAGNYYLCTSALYLAQREAERGDNGDGSAQANAAAQLSKAWQFCNQTQNTDQATYNTLVADIATMTNYVNSLAPASQSLGAQTATSDQTYQNSQVLTPGQLDYYAQDNADTQAALDAQAAGGSASATYAASTVTNAVANVAKPAGQAVANAAGSASSWLATTATSILGPWGSYIALGIVLLVFVGGAYIVAYRKAAPK